MESLQATPLPLELSDRLSPELYDRFIDHLHSFKHSLSACSTVCQSWFPSSRYHLFFDVNLSPDLVHFLHSSSHAMETITPYIHDVALGGAWISELRSKFDVVISLLLKLKSCRELYLETWSWDFLSDTSKNLLLRSERSFFKDITVIHLKYIRFPSFSLLIEFIGRFPTLQDLSFDNVTWNPEDSQISREAQAYFPRPLRLTKLYIRSCLVEPILSWLFGDDEQILQTPPIHVLALPEILSGELNVVGRVLRALGSSLQHVELGFLSPNLRDSPNHALSTLVDLSFNTNLRRIHVHQLTLYHFPLKTPLSFSPDTSAPSHLRPHSPYFWLIPMLTGIISSHLEEVVLVMWLSAEPQLELIDWAAMSELLLSHRFFRLQRIRFEVMGMGRNQEQVRTWLRTRLDQWTAAEAASGLEVKFIDGY